MQVSDWLVPLSSVAVAFIAFIGVYVTARSRKQPSTSEVWAENSSLRDRLDKQDEKINKQDEKIDDLDDAVRTVGRGFDVLYRLFGRAATDSLEPDDRDAVEAARRLRKASHASV